MAVAVVSRTGKWKGGRVFWHIFSVNHRFIVCYSFFGHKTHFLLWHAWYIPAHTVFHLNHFLACPSRTSYFRQKATEGKKGRKRKEKILFDTTTCTDFLAFLTTKHDPERFFSSIAFDINAFHNLYVATNFHLCGLEFLVIVALWNRWLGLTWKLFGLGFCNEENCRKYPSTKCSVYLNIINWDD